MRRGSRLDRLDGRVVALAGLAAVLFVAGTAWRFGPPVSVALTAAVIVGGLLLFDARAALLAFVALVTLVEAEARTGFADTSLLYGSLVPPVQLLFVGVIVAVALFAARPGVGAQLPGPFTLPLLLLAVAMVVGAVTGSFGGATVGGIVGPLTILAPLVILPFLIATVARAPGDGRRMVRAGVGLAAARAVLGLGAFYTVGTVDAGLGDRSTSYEAASNWPVMVLIFGLAAAVLARMRLSPRLLLLIPIATLALTLSYRRSFWIAAVLGILVVVVVASGRVGRRLIVPTLLLLGVATYVALSAGVATDLQGPVVQRVQSLDPSRVAASEQDRYRIGERRNVLAEIRDHPLTGIGLGVDWRGRYGVTLAYTDQRNYVHFGFLWFYLKLGVLGAIAYLWIFGAALSTGLQVFRRHPDPAVRVAGLAVGVGALGLAVAELTASFIGPVPRMTIVFAAALGFLAVAHREAAAAQAAPLSAPERATEAVPA